jgi:hypothetical protein
MLDVFVMYSTRSFEMDLHNYQPEPLQILRILRKEAKIQPAALVKCSIPVLSRTKIFSVFDTHAFSPPSDVSTV